MITLSDKTIVILRHVVTLRPVSDPMWEVRLTDGRTIAVSSDEAASIRRALSRID